MNTSWKVAAGLPGLVFVAMGLLWLVAPGFVSGQLRMELLSGDGLSTQIGDLASFFLVMGACILIGLNTGNRVWLYPSIMLLGLAAIGRTISWLFHGAALAIDMIVVEVVVATILIIVSGKLADR
ncbi:MAG: hypothetical protein AAFR45_03440 [Pseudomonadota bacterium]